jgi:hypothetical protein
MDVPKRDLTWSGLADAELPDVNDLTMAELRELLRSTGSDPDEIACGFYERLALEIVARRDPKSESLYVVDGGTRAGGVNARALSDFVSSQLFVHYRPHTQVSWDRDAWSGTHLVAHALQGARRHGMSLDDRTSVLEGAFGAVERVLGERVTGPSAAMDSVWPILECLEETATEVTDEPALVEFFAERYARLLGVDASPVVVPVLGWGMNEFLERGERSAELASHMARAMLATNASEQIACLVYLLRELRPSSRRYLPEVGSLSAASRDLMTSLLAQVKSARVLLRNTVEGLDPKDVAFDGLVNDDFQQILSLTRSSVPLAATLAMMAVKLVLQEFCGVLKSVPEERHLPLVTFMCRQVVECVSDEHSAFLAIEAVEGVRDKYPREAAIAMGDLLLAAPPNLRQGLFVCTIEGYEERYGGERQPAVPAYVRHDGRLRFETQSADPLDEFTRKAAALAESDEDMVAHLEWANARWNLWSSEAAA